MGCCCSSQDAKLRAKRRRRLSLGFAGKCDGDEEAPEEDRGLIAALTADVIQVLNSQGQQGDRKFSICSGTDEGKESFADKTIKQLGDHMDPSALGIGFTCRKGLKPESPNQDAWSVLNVEGDYSIYGVFDGHGAKGHEISNFVKDNLPKLIIRDPRFKTDKMGPMLKDVYKKTQHLVASMDRSKKLQAQMSGTTATVIVHDHKENKLTVSHVADSTAVLGRYDERTGRIEAIPLTIDHKPNLKAERRRIERAGGRVAFDGYANFRVYSKNGRYPGLNMSRSLGDLVGHAEAGCSSEPDVCECAIQAGDRVLLMCSDGVWEFMSHEEAVELVLESQSISAQEAANKLAKEAWDRWMHEEGGAVVDDITVVLVFF